MHNLCIDNVVSLGGIVQKVKEILNGWREGGIYFENSQEQVINILLEGSLGRQQACQENFRYHFLGSGNILAVIMFDL